MTRRPALLAIALLTACAGAQAQATKNAEPTKFDGAWSVTLVCPPHNAADDDAKGYTHRFPGQVVNGELGATHGREGEPGWHFLHGRIAPDGRAALRLDGMVNNPKYAINDAPRGKEYSYRVKATFDEASGSGQRVTGRACEFTFAR